MNFRDGSARRQTSADADLTLKDNMRYRALVFVHEGQDFPCILVSWSTHQPKVIL
jgi:hypothetical protein